ncbi:hypothetical protein MTR_2g105500 [Medicago truncatula]|uniref:Uncharacterized protein n=1 Tax=Medicago truncatula TaxID=3880 RepID=A0A072VCA8_MEDTR|nr:hypothetical protein MTR_2g105500 [Medicago truncatula]
MGSITRWGAAVLWVVQNSKKRKLGSRVRVGPHGLGELGLNRFGSSLVWFRRTEPVQGIYRARLMLGFVGAEPKISNLGRRKRERVTKILDLNRIWMTKRV